MKSTLLLLITLIVFGYHLSAQNNFSGVWNGTLNIAGHLKLILHVNQSADGSYSGSLDSPDQNVTGITCDKVIVTESILNFTISKIKVSYTGTLINDSTLSGTFTQGVNLPLDLHRTGAPFVAKAVVRPQTPKPPFPYKNEEVIYSNNGLQYSGTITVPQGKGPFPALILITGSGQQDRDETIFNHKPFAVLADALTKNGFVVLRVDDRGKGSSTGSFINSTTADFVNDVNATVDYLKSRPEVNDKKIGLLGHSEGAMIAPVVASQRNDVKFIVLLAAPGVNIIDLMTEQNAAVTKSVGIDATVADDFKLYYKQILQAAITIADSFQLQQKTIQLLNNFAASATDTASLKAMQIFSPQEKLRYAMQIDGMLRTPWFQYFLKFDPQPYLTKLKKVKVLALNGSKDIQVVSSQNLPAVRSALVQGSTKKFEVKEIPGVNHLFQTCNTCTVAEYGLLQETISPVVLQTINEWLNKNAK